MEASIANSQYFIYVHEWPWRWWERLLYRLLGGIGAPMRPGEVEADFGPYFQIEKVMVRRLSGYIAGEAAYLMTRKERGQTPTCDVQQANKYKVTLT